MAFKFPFTNYHELNLTWVLDQLKKLFEESAENVSTIQNYDGRLTAVETELPTVSENASEASRAAAAAGTLAQTAKATADTAQENAIQAQTLAGTARQEAQTAQTAADAATQAAQQAQATARNFDGRITQAENDASQALEASRSFENRVQAAITTANNAAQTATNAQGIAMRADQNAAEALDRIGNLSDLTTEAKQTLVAAINEAAQTGKDCPGYIINTASGAVVSFPDGAANRPIENLVANIEPIQDLHGYESPWLAGYGKNMFRTVSQPITEQGVTWSPNSDGTISVSGVATGYTSFYCGDALVNSSMGTVAISVRGIGGNTNIMTSVIAVYNSSGNVLETITGGSQSETYIVDLSNLADAYRIGVNIKRNNNGPTNGTVKIQVERGSTVTSWAPYENICPLSGWTSCTISHSREDTSNPDTISIIFPSEAGTVYGGNLNVITGLLTVNRGFKVYDGSADERISNYSGQRFVLGCDDYSSPAVGVIDSIITNRLRTIAKTSQGSAIGVISASDPARPEFMINIGLNTVSEVRSWLAENPLQVSYPLNNPVTYQLTPHEMTTFYGINNIWVDTGNSDVTYQADTKLYIDNKIADTKLYIDNITAEMQALILEH